MPVAFPRLSSASLSEQGYVRPNNEDRIYCDDARGIYVVVDGMGGHAAGEQAATVAIERMRARLERVTDSPEQRLREAIALANNAIYEAALSNPAWRGMACVLTAAIVEQGQAIVGHVGDSRLYKIRRGVIQKMTRDHSPVGEREDAGEITESEAMHHPSRNEVYRDIGSGEHAPDDPNFVDITHFAFEPDSAILLCSDGLTDVIASEQILRTVEENAPDPQAIVRLLTAAATRVGHDNVSVVFVEGEGFASANARARVPSSFDGNGIEAERTDRLALSPAKPGRQRRWYTGATAFFFYGVTVATAVAIGASDFLLRPPLTHRQSRTILVTAPMTISQALEAAVAGDSLVLSPGTYTEVVHLKNGINLSSQKRREAIIEGFLIAEGGTHVRVEGVRISATDLGVVARDSEVTLQDDEISGAHEAGVEFLGSARGLISGCNIHDNPGIGIAVLDAAAPEIHNNVVIANGTMSGKPRPGLLVRSEAGLKVSGNIFAGNGGEALSLPHEDPLVAQGNAFSLGSEGAKRSPVRARPHERNEP